MRAAIESRFAAEGLAPSAWSNEPGDRYAEHRHGYDKVLVVTAGSIVFTLPERTGSVELGPGDRLDLPAGTLHGALVGPAGVVCLEAHLDRGALGSDPRLRLGWATRETAATQQA